MNGFGTGFLKRMTKRSELNLNRSDEIGRSVRTFEVEAIAPYVHKVLVAFLKAKNLHELTPRETGPFRALGLGCKVSAVGRLLAEMAPRDISEGHARAQRSASTAVGLAERRGHGIAGRVKTGDRLAIPV